MDDRNIIEFSNSYPCPFCLQGEIKNLILTEALACDFCQHIFTVNLEERLLKIEDSQTPILWSWNGRSWHRIREREGEIGWGYWVGAIAFIFLPTTLVGTAAYLFPPLEGSNLSWFPLLWTALAFISHLACLFWLILEYYQFPLGLYLWGKAQSWLGLDS
jgi:hypothetical protein